MRPGNGNDYRTGDKTRNGTGNHDQLGLGPTGTTLVSGEAQATDGTTTVHANAKMRVSRNTSARGSKKRPQLRLRLQWELQVEREPGQQAE